MQFLSAFDVLGPIMVGPSSSHTAGGVSIGLLAGKMCPEPIHSVRFTLYGSFAQTYLGHGTDKALLSGILGFGPDDLRIRDAFTYAVQYQVAYEYIVDQEYVPDHPNTVDIHITGIYGYQLSVRGISSGGGKIKITRINGIQVEFTGEFSTLIIKQIDKPGAVSHITKCLSNHNVNIAFMRLFRENKGEEAYTIVESDDPIPPEILEEVKQNEDIREILLIQL